MPLVLQLLLALVLAAQLQLLLLVGLLGFGLQFAALVALVLHAGFALLVGLGGGGWVSGSGRVFSGGRSGRSNHTAAEVPDTVFERCYLAVGVGQRLVCLVECALQTGFLAYAQPPHQAHGRAVATLQGVGLPGVPVLIGRFTLLFFLFGLAGIQLLEFGLVCFQPDLLLE